jgi:hypothetical protein
MPTVICQYNMHVNQSESLSWSFSKFVRRQMVSPKKVHVQTTWNFRKLQKEFQFHVTEVVKVMSLMCDNWMVSFCKKTTPGYRLLNSSSIDNSHSDRSIFYLGKKSIFPVRTSILKWVKLQSLIAKCCKMRPKCGSNFRTQYKSIQNLQTLQGYIFRILQHFATKSSCGDLFASPCLVLKLVYNGNCQFKV